LEADKVFEFVSVGLEVREEVSELEVVDVGVEVGEARGDGPREEVGVLVRDAGAVTLVEAVPEEEAAEENVKVRLTVGE